jgi:peptidyl-prolyl cis-trans isomerase SurA
MRRSVFSQTCITRSLALLVLCTVFPLTHAAESTRKGNTSGRHSTPASKAPAAAPDAAAPAAAAPLPDQFVDGIAAVVNKDVITLREVADATAAASTELSRQGIQLPPADVLRKQVLQRLIMQRLQRQEATRLNIKIDDKQIDQAIAGIAARNKISVDQMRKEIEKTASWDQYRRNLYNEVLSDRLRQRVVDSTIVISDAEVDAFLKEQSRRAAGGSAIPGNAPAADSAPVPAPAADPAPQAAANEQLTLGQILVRVPEGSTTAQIAVLRKKAEDILARLKSGGDFANLAAATSDGPEALQGGSMGARPLDGWPDLFVNAVANLKKGGLSEIIQSGNGFHILKVLDRSRAAGPAAAPQAPQAPQPPQGADAQQQSGPLVQQGPMQVTQTHARHILIKTSAVMTDDQAKQRLNLLRQRIVSGGEDFGTLARQNSQDASAPQGGDLGWLSPGETVPPFEQAMNALQTGEVSEPIQSPFGWHLIQVLERRQKDVADEMQRLQARRILFERRAEPAFEDWLDQLRDQAYIDNRLEKQSQRDKNNQ